MGERGRPPKPTNLRMLHGEKRPSHLNTNEPQPRTGTPEAPEWLPDPVREVWDRTVVELTAMRVLTLADRDPLVAYCVAVVHHREATELVAKKGLVVKGRMGELVKNPAAQLVRDQALLVKVLAQQFGLTPAARVGLAAPAKDEPGGAERLLS